MSSITKCVKFIAGVSLIALAIGLFYGIFFKLTPYIASTIPSGDWHNFLSIVVYCIIGYFGGIALPISIAIIGVLVLLTLF